MRSRAALRNINIIQNVMNILERKNDVTSKTAGCGPISRYYYGI